MAYVSTIYCPTCQKDRQVTCNSGQVKMECDECTNLKATRKEREWKATKEGLTVEERLREIEHFIYHHGNHYKGPQLF